MHGPLIHSPSGTVTKAGVKGPLFVALFKKRNLTEEDVQTAGRHVRGPRCPQPAERRESQPRPRGQLSRRPREITSLSRVCDARAAHALEGTEAAWPLQDTLRRLCLCDCVCPQQTCPHTSTQELARQCGWPHHPRHPRRGDDSNISIQGRSAQPHLLCVPSAVAFGNRTGPGADTCYNTDDP